MGLVVAALLTACAPPNAETSTVIPATSIPAPILPTPTIVPPTATKTPTKEPTPTHTPSPTPEPPQINITEKLTEKGIFFPEDTTSRIESHRKLGDLEFSIALSEKVLERSKIKYFHIPPEVLERNYEQMVGEVGVFARNDNMDELFYFNVAASDIEAYYGHGGGGSTDIPSIRNQAVTVLKKYGSIPLTFHKENFTGPYNDRDISGRFRNVNYHIVAEEEFSNLEATVQEAGIVYAKKPKKEIFPGKEGYNSDFITFFNGDDTLEIYQYNSGYRKPAREYWDPIEYMGPHHEKYLYLLSVYESCIVTTEQLRRIVSHKDDFLFKYVNYSFVNLEYLNCVPEDEFVKGVGYYWENLRKANWLKYCNRMAERTLSGK